MVYSTPSFPVHHQLPEAAQTHVHWVSEAIQLSHPLLSPSPPAFNLSQYQGVFKWISSSHQVAKVLALQHQSFWRIFRLISFRIDWFNLPAVQGLSRVFSNTTVQKYQIFSVHPSLSNSHPCMTTGNTTVLTIWTFFSKVMSTKDISKFYPVFKLYLRYYLLH